MLEKNIDKDGIIDLLYHYTIDNQTFKRLVGTHIP